MSNFNGKRTGGLLVAAAVAATLTACASMPEAPPGSAAVRTRLTTLKSQPLLAEQVPTFLQAAEQATVLAETPQRDAELARHRVYLADRLVETARATAETRLAESQRAALKRQSDESRLVARTREAEAAQRAASAARADAVRSAAEAARIGEDQRATQRQQNEDARVALRTLEADAADRARNDVET